MKILALDSSGLVASVAVVSDDNLIGEYTINYKKTHSQTLLPMLDEVAKMTELDLKTIDFIAVSAGPGSFTGLRIGSATAKLLLDVMMGGMSGFQMAKKLKENPVTANIPIIFLTARDTENDTVTGFNLGADDYISKPFSIREVMVRIRAVLRRTAEQNGTAEEPTTIGYQGLLLNLDKKTVSIDGENVPFTKTEFELLRLLLEEKGRVFSRQELIDRVWPKDVMVLDRTVDVNITRMRKKVGRFAKCIVTRLGFGYYFDA